MYDYREYRFRNEGLEMCASNDSKVQALWKTRNSWEKFNDQYKCRGFVKNIHAWDYALTKQFTVYLADNGQYFTRNDYAVIHGKPNVCEEKLRPRINEYTQEDLLMCNDSIINIKYDVEYKVRTDFSILYKNKVNKVYDYTEYRVLDDGIKICNSTDNYVRNIWKLRNAWVKEKMHYKSCNKPMSIYKFRQKFYTVRKDFSVLMLLPTYQVIAKYDYGVFEGQVIKIPCDGRIEITVGFIFYSILMNAAANIYHLRKTFCGNTLVKCNTLVKSDENKWKTFLKYSLFSWGVPVIITIVGIVLVKKDVLRFQRDSTGCVKGNELPLWLAVMAQYGLLGCLVLYIIVMFSLTAYRIRQKLKAIRNIAQKSNIVKKRNSFVVLLKLSTTTAISFFPILFLKFMEKLDVKIKLTLLTVASLTGVYIGIAFVVTRKNYRLLKKKYFPAKKKPINA
ncbi:Hypothetical predicted protein [Paramuricea clavata]|uniref:Uncharacterized protein n=1 Tax=Paramuricea clavata TaxID=317549 RepID=A0A6S7GBZ2_PARCT|nr:Hypothetical predicted protein [Paramuricea clavata]